MSCSFQHLTLPAQPQTAPGGTLSPAPARHRVCSHFRASIPQVLFSPLLPVSAPFILTIQHTYYKRTETKETGYQSAFIRGCPEQDVSLKNKSQPPRRCPPLCTRTKMRFISLSLWGLKLKKKNLQLLFPKRTRCSEQSIVVKD